MKKEFSFDLDGVLYPFDIELGKFIKRNTNIPAKTENKITSWNIWEHWEISKKEFIDSFNSFILSGGFEHGEVIGDAIQTLNTLYYNGYRVRLTTARHAGLQRHKATIFQQTVIWLEKHEIAYHDLLFLEDKSSTKFDLHVDDAEHHLAALKQSGLRAVAFNQGWNQNWDGERIYSLSEVLNLV